MLLDDPKLPESWWKDLDAALDALAAHPLNLDNELGAVRYTINGTQAHLGVELPEEIFADLEWTTAHADLHWGNLRGPELCILDWESWRPAPAGYDVATLYCTSLVSDDREQERDLPAAGLLWVAGEGSDIDQLDGSLREEATEILSGFGAGTR